MLFPLHDLVLSRRQHVHCASQAPMEGEIDAKFEFTLTLVAVRESVAERALTIRWPTAAFVTAH